MLGDFLTPDRGDVRNMIREAIDEFVSELEFEVVEVHSGLRMEFSKYYLVVSSGGGEGKKWKVPLAAETPTLGGSVHLITPSRKVKREEML